MYTQTIYELSQEAERLLQLALHHLDTVNRIPGAEEATSPQAAQATLLSAQQDILTTELRKMTRLEMVLAIVGTMKAGKSTTINAIVGTEVLPNRNRPMTALPTLIRHTPGQKEPALHFNHVEPIERLMHQLQARLQKTDRALLTQKLEVDKDMNALLDSISDGIAFEKHYLGAQPIFHCLKSLNDLVRLSQALDVKFPFADYTLIEHIPIIEVEFVHLAGLSNQTGQFTLLDTPGPNEAGQPHLQKMLNEQLMRASALLVVMDYTQLKSISDQDLRQAIAAVNQSVPLYALVNKFDQKDRNSDDENEIRALISGTLMKGLISPQHIYPVSSMWGYLANRARYELDTHGKLPDHHEQRWVQDFAEAALGRRWRSEALDDFSHIRHAAELLWEDSLFEKPITLLLHAAHANASIFALRSASHKLLNYTTDAREYLEFRQQGLTLSADRLEENIARLDAEMAQFTQRQQGVIKDMEREVIGAVDAANIYIAEKQQAILQVVENSLSQHNLQAMCTANGADLRLTPQGVPGELIVEDEGQAHRLLNLLRADCEATVFTAQHRIVQEVTQRISQLESSLSHSLEAALRPIETQVKEGLQQSGFRSRMMLPAFQPGALQLTLPPWFNDAVVTKERQTESMTRGGSLRDSVSRWFNNPGWSWDKYVVAKTRYIIDINAIRVNIIDSVERFFTQLRQAIAAQADGVVKAGMAPFLEAFSQSLSSLQHNLQVSLTVRQQHQSKVSTMCQQLQSSLAALRWLEEDARLLRDDIHTLFTAKPI